LVAIPFLIWDGIFTNIGVWGFNSKYHLSLYIFKMPIEEWLFFFCIPYASLFTHEVLKFLYPNIKIKKTRTIEISIFLISISGLLLFLNFGKLYTTVNFIFFLALIFYGLKKRINTLQEYFPSFLIILIPFLIVNGILTGSFIDESVVWYNNKEIIGFRLFTIPIEDMFYAFNLLFSIQLIFNILNHKNDDSK
jgi:lycopene cyclase domain-containing protein